MGIGGGKRASQEMPARAPPDRCRLPRFESPSEASPRFEVDDGAALEYLRQHGYVVIAAALAAEEVREAVGLFWDYVEQSSRGQVRRGCPETWAGDAWDGSSQNGLFEQGGVGQSAFLWYVRLRPKVLEAFRRVWGLAGPEDLIMSFDGCCAFRPTSYDASWRTLGGWYHTDQNARITGTDLVCVQGFVSLLDQDEKTGGLAVLPGSHLRHGELFGGWADRSHRRDFCILPKDDPLLVGPKCIPARLVRARAGDLVLWDSRCVHCNVPAWHRFDEEPFSAALSEAGLADVDEPFLQNCSSMADAAWYWHNVVSEQRGIVEPRLEALFEVVAGRLRAELQAEPPPPDADLLRLVAYVCARPRQRASPEVLRDKRRGALLGATATHWPDRAELKSLAAESPGVRAATMDPFGLPALGLRLLGCEGPDLGAMRAELKAELEPQPSSAAGPDVEPTEPERNGQPPAEFQALD